MREREREKDEVCGREREGVRVRVEERVRASETEWGRGGESVCIGERVCEKKYVWYRGREREWERAKIVRYGRISVIERYHT